MKKQQPKKLVVFFDRDGRFLGALPEDARLGDVGAVGLSGVRAIERMDRGAIAREIENEQLDDFAESELAKQNEEDAWKLARELDAKDGLSASGPFADMNRAIDAMLDDAERVLANIGKRGKK